MGGIARLKKRIRKYNRRRRGMKRFRGKKANSQLMLRSLRRQEKSRKK